MKAGLGIVIVTAVVSQSWAQEVHLQVGASDAPAAPQPLRIDAALAPPPVSALPPEQSDRRPGRPIEATIDSSNLHLLLEEQRGRSTFVRSWRNADGSTGSKIEDLRHWEPICQTPCGIAVDSGGLYRIAGPDVVPSGEFMLPQNQAAVSLRVKAGDVHRRRAGIALLTIGPVLVVTGVVLALFRGYWADTYVDIGISSLAVGVGGVAAGAALFATNGTRVIQAARTTTWLGAVELSPTGIAF